MLQKSKDSSSTQKHPQTIVKKAFGNIDILISISEFIDDKDLFSFILINKTTYKTLSRSRLIEVRLLKYQLKNARSIIQELEPQIKEKAKLIKKKEEKAKLQAPKISYTFFQPYYFNAHVLDQSLSRYILDGKVISQQPFEIDQVTGLGKNLELELANKKAREQKKIEIISDIDQKLKQPSQVNKQKGLFISNSQTHDKSYYKSLSQISSKSEVKKKQMMYAIQKEKTKQQNNVMDFDKPKKGDSLPTYLYNKTSEFFDAYLRPTFNTKHI